MSKFFSCTSHLWNSMRLRILKIRVIREISGFKIIFHKILFPNCLQEITYNYL